MKTPPMRFIPNSDEDVREMLETIGVESLDQLFDSIPPEVRLDRYLKIPEPWSELEVRRWFAEMAKHNISATEAVSFLGAGVYPHYQPSCVDQMLLRSEFLTAYTPYQPEVSQGTLQAIFEYQTHQCLLTGLDVANASLYDGSTAFAEAVLIADRVAKGRNKVVVAGSIHPEYRETLRTYVNNLDIEIVEVGWTDQGRVDIDQMEKLCDASTMAVAVQSPNFFGVIEDYDSIREVADAAGARKIAVIAEASSLGILVPPGQRGFDIAVGEGQAWGIPPQFGGPFVGFMVVRDDLKRFMPGRLVGETVDVDGRRAWVLTLATREQHIRREKATSNICTNQALIALAANMYLSLMGKKGIREVADQCLQKAHYLIRQIEGSDGIELPFSGPVYNEFVIRTERPAREVLADLAERKILGGVPLSRYFDDRPNEFLVAVTEIHTCDQIDGLARGLKAVAR